ncbi:MAG: hypothetical protein LBR08_06350 [Bacteroidales bacterium]|jgi:seryl-tRNA synthetase|nr:hypothetical protein [Bacteroidales bacterium]
MNIKWVISPEISQEIEKISQVMKTGSGEMKLKNGKMNFISREIKLKNEKMKPVSREMKTISREMKLKNRKIKKISGEMKTISREIEIISLMFFPIFHTKIRNSEIIT